MTTTTDHECTYGWCLAHGVCDWPCAQALPHRRGQCRYATDNQADAEEPNRAT